MSLDKNPEPPQGPAFAQERQIWYLQVLADTRAEVIELCKERIERLETDLKNQQNWQFINYN